MMKNVEEVTYPISELFVSPQGEGRNTGVLMQFIRLAGCSVGKPFTQIERETQKLPIYQERCTIYDGRTFACDTDFRVKERKTVHDIVAWAVSNDVRTVILTGGEPLIHDLTPLLSALKRENFDIHMETSGTVIPNLNQKLWKLLDWVCVSPKLGFKAAYADMGIANEFKLLIDEFFSWDTVPSSIQRKPHKVSLSPLNDEKTINWDNVQRCLAIQKQHPEVRITMQMHKLWGVR